MAAMKRLALVVLLLAAVVTGTARTAHAATPCRDKIYNQWYASGKIATTYPVACYRDALKHVPADARVYSSLTDDIQSALQGALARAQGKKVPATVGKGKVSTGPGGLAGTTQTLHSTKPEPTSSPGTIASGTTSGSGGGIPTPIIILAAIALLLAAAGAAGAGVRHFRGR
jgi:hypothetical protein